MDWNGQQRRNTIAGKILIAAACAVAVLCSVVGISIAYLRSTPAYKIGKGLRNLGSEIVEAGNPLAGKAGLGELTRMLAQEGGHIGTKLNFTSDRLFGGTLGIDTECYKDMAGKELSADTSVSLMNYEFGHLHLYADAEALCFSVPELFLENMYIDNENVVSQYNGSFLAGLSGPIDAEDFSIDLFADVPERLDLQDWKSTSGSLKRYAKDLEALQDKLVMEKAEPGVYRVVCPQAETGRLLRDLLEDYGPLYEPAGAGQRQIEYDRLVDTDISVLFEINRQNRIECIRLEEPAGLLDGAAAVSGSLCFLGDARSIDRIQGDISVQGDDAAEREIHFRILQTPSADSYALDLDVELTEGQDSLLRVKYATDSDAVKDTFDAELALWNDDMDMEFMLEGSLDDMEKGRSLELDLEEMAFYMDGESVFRITGDILLEPLDGAVVRTVRKETAFFGMSEQDWLDILYRIMGEYGDLLNLF